MQRGPKVDRADFEYRPIFSNFAKHKDGIIMKKGLVLEGGALRGLFSAGVIDVMMENGISYDGLVGVSAGAAFGCNYKSRQPGRALRYNKRYAHYWKYCSLRSLIVSGDLFNGEFDYHVIPERLDTFDDEAFEDNPMEFYAVCTDMETGQAVYKQLSKGGYECYEWIRASASMPIASRVVEIGGRKLLDGGIADSIPLGFFESKGYERNVVVLTQPEGYMKHKNRFLPLMRLQLHRYPRFLETTARRHEVYNDELRLVAQREAEGKAFVIRPKQTLPIKHITHDTDLMQRVYDEGRHTMEQRLQELKDFLGE